MPNESLTALTQHHLEVARSASSGRSAQTLYGGHDHVMRQTLIALRAGSVLDEHENPGDIYDACGDKSIANEISGHAFALAKGREYVAGRV